MEELLKQIDLLKNEIASMKQSKSLPVGIVEAFATPVPPTGWIVCNGQELRIDDYRELYNAIGNVFNDEHTPEGFFCVPDLQGRFIRGWDEDGNRDPESQFGRSQEDALQGHRHVLKMSSNKTKKDGAHYHYIGYEKKWFGAHNVRDNYECKSLANHDDPSVYSYGDNDRAIHEHELPKIEVTNVSDSSYGKVNVSCETRPKNIALLYCIKAK